MFDLIRGDHCNNTELEHFPSFYFPQEIKENVPKLFFRNYCENMMKWDERTENCILGNGLRENPTCSVPI